MSHKLSRLPLPAAVSTVYVEVAQVWFRCPHCDVALGGYTDDPRGQSDVRCEDCGGDFYISQQARLVLE